MEIFFVPGEPVLIAGEERLLVAGDIHIGRDLKLRREGIHVPNATGRMADKLLQLYKRYKARGIVLLGDVKESVAYPDREEKAEIMDFFYRLRGARTMVTKGNHDPRLEEILERIDAEVEVGKEILLDKVALMHGHAMPSDEAMLKRYIVTGHSHPAVRINGNLEKAWVVAPSGKGAGKAYGKYDKRIRLVMMPAFNELITGGGMSGLRKFSPLMRKGIFDFDRAEVYGIDRKRLGKAAGLDD